ncbi:GIY-YIG nuclease family protein [Duffyella gerundensis]|uniref:GIY-YIG nuclease family protein n=1 Tax=Duffyella gerundensis TaxID=1619313 RepID=UPI0016541989|nr:GIY-YIG nuclease family protein [Duffyella gerundensis]
MNNFIERASRIGRLYSEYLRTQTGEMDVLAEIQKMGDELKAAGCVNSHFFNALLRQGFMHDMMSVYKQMPSGKPHVYVLHAEESGLTKIGFSTRVDKRVSEISRMSGAPLKMIAKIPAQRDLETELHQKYGGFRAHGEWFSLRKEHLLELSSHPGNLIAKK